MRPVLDVWYIYAFHIPQGLIRIFEKFICRAIEWKYRFTYRFKAPGSPNISGSIDKIEESIQRTMLLYILLTLLYHNYRPYYQCRHCTFASHNLQLIEKHVTAQHTEDQRYVCPLCDLAYCKYEEGTKFFENVKYIHLLCRSVYK